MNNLSYYYSALFDESKYFEKWYELFHFTILISMVASIYSNGFILYTVGIIGLLGQIGLFVSKYLKNRSQALAHQLHQISMINIAYNKKSHNFEVSQIIGKMSLRAHRIVQKKIADQDDSTKYNPPTEQPGFTKLKFMIQENAYWNHHLFNICSKKSWRKFYITIGGIIIFIFISISLRNSITIDPQYSLLRLLLIFLSFFRIWEEVEKALIWQNASEEMLVVDNNLDRLAEGNEESVALIFSNYNVAKESTHLIPDKIYNVYYQKLHEGWALRKMGINKN